MSSSPPADANIFSLRIVSLDYYMSSPIDGLDVTYSSFQSGNVEEVPVIRIYGSTPAGQKACLHIHKALPYLYIPCPEYAIKSPQEGPKFLHKLSISLEKALKSKGNSATKRQHVHDCCLVRAKKFYGYHTSDDLFVKICHFLGSQLFVDGRAKYPEYEVCVADSMHASSKFPSEIWFFRYYPHEVLSTATMLLDGAILNTCFQPYESHIPYLLHFLVDYNLYGMGHIHLSKYNFRSPLPDNHIPPGSSFQNNGTKVHENLAVWLSSTVSGDLILSDNKNHFIMRQSCCTLEVDASVNDILNETHKMYTSLSQTRSDIKMVQSLVPIWEEEYERAGTQDTIPPDMSKPAPENVLSVFNEGFEYEKVFGELCAEINKIFLSKNVEIEDVKIDRSVESTIAAGKVSVDELGDSIENKNKNTSTPFKYLLLENKETMASENLNHSDGLNFTSDKKLATNISNPDQECVDTDALGLLNWLASSQAAADVSTDDELVSEPILSPFLSKKTYKEALKIAHLDYEHASQIECQDILDTVEDFDKDQISLSSDQNCTVSCSSSYAIPQVDGPVDEYTTPGIGGDSEVNMTSEGKMLTRKRSKHKNNEHLWGTLPFTFNQKWQDNFEPTVSTPYNDQLIIDDNIHTGKRSKSVPLDSARDLMRRRRHLRTNVIKDIEKTQFSSKEHPTYNFEAHGDSSFGNQAIHNTHDVTRGFMKTCNMKLFAQEHTSLDGETANTNKDTDMCTRNLITAIKEHMDDQDSENRITELDYLQNKQIQDTKQNAQDVEGNVSGYGRHEPANHDCITSCVLDKRNHTVEYAEMSFNMKPPSRDEVDRFPDNLTESTTYAEKVFRECTGDFPPFYMAKFEEEKLNKLLNDENLNLGQQSYLGVSTHFQNDGSILYMLTHATLPPTQESVTQWISEVTRGKNLGDSPDVHHCLKPDISSQEVSTAVHTESQGNRKVLEENNEEGTHIKEQARKNELYDFSQISGPGHEEKSELTPLSQIGFRDPASHGGGQQLTLISIEVHAESRGDLLPDPKVDAINVICIAIQEDSCHMVEVYVLIRASNDESNKRHIDGIPDCKFSIFDDEYHMFDHFIKLFSSFDPDIIIGWEIQGGSLGFLAERAIQLNISLLKRLSRIPTYETKAVKSDNTKTSKLDNNPLVADVIPEYSVIEDEWGRTHASGIHISGRIVLNVWRLMRSELKLNMYTVEAVAEEVLRRKIPSISNQVLSHWFQSGPAKARHKCIQYVNERAKLNLQIMNQLDMINRTSELARVFGIDFFSVLSRGSQYRVESMLLRLAHTQNYLAISAGNQQVASQPAMECLPLVMEPESGFYTDPVVVLDFQSLYPSMIIAYNLCYSTCLGSIYPSKTNVLGVTSYLPDPLFLKDSKQLLVTPNGVMYVPSEVRRGVLPRLLEEILTTRIMVKQAMKKLTPSQQVLQRIFNARQLALKLIANVTYGYTAAGFSGRMPCAELADSIVQCGRRTLETAISYVNHHDTWKAKVIYGDTDSMFVLLKGRSREEAFRIGNEIASAITAMNPYPVTLKMEKVYQPCFLLTKKRYVGYSYESPTQDKPIFDAKGIETVRRDTCPTVAKTLERSIRLMFEHQDISMVKTYLQRQWRRIISGKVSLQDFVFAKEVRLGTYSTRASALPPAAIVAQKAMQNDPRAEPKFGERIPYVVIHGEPGARLVDMVVNPYVLLDINSPYRLNELYYINKQIIPALQRVLGLVGADLNKWFSELPRPIRQTLTKRYPSVSYSGSMLESGNDMRTKSSRIDTYYSSKHCIICGKIVQASNYLCGSCSKKETLVATVMVGKASKLEREIQHLAAICTHCGGADNIVESGIKCTSLACSVFYERRKVQKELLTVSSFATAKGFYPMCMAEWF